MRGEWEERHPWEMPRPVACLVFIRAREARAHGEQQGAGWALGTPDHGKGRPGKPSFAGGLPTQYLGLAASRWSLAFFPMELVAVTLPCSHFLPLPSYHHAPTPHHLVHSRVLSCTKMHLRCQGSPSEGPFLRCPVLQGRSRAAYTTRLCSKGEGGGKAITRQIGCTPRGTCRRCCRWSIKWHKPETYAMNREPVSRQSQHQNTRARTSMTTSTRARARTSNSRLCDAAMQLAVLAVLRWCGLGRPVWPDLDSASHPHPLQTGFWPTGQHDRPHHVTPATANHPSCRRSKIAELH